MNQDQNQMRSLEPVLGAFSVLYDKGMVSLQICYKGVPIQVITFGTLNSMSGLIADKQHRIDAENAGWQILLGFTTAQIEDIPEHLIAKALAIDDPLSQHMWMSQRRHAHRQFKMMTKVKDLVPLKELLANEEPNYRFYEA